MLIAVTSISPRHHNAEAQAIRAKQIETLRKRRKVAAYLDFKPYQFAA